jgi:hypothetical protein
VKNLQEIVHAALAKPGRQSALAIAKSAWVDFVEKLLAYWFGVVGAQQ